MKKSTYRYKNKIQIKNGIGGFFIRKKLLFCAVLMLVLTTMTSVDATLIDETTDNALAEHFEENPEILNGNPEGFSMLNDEINSSSQTKSLKMTKDYVFNQQNDGKFADGINITIDNLIIDGQGHTIDANKKARIFNIQSNNVTLKNINIINGNATSHGGAIYWEGLAGNITNCLFKNCTSPNSGGAILFKNHVSIENTKFIGNSAFFGGGVNLDSESQIINCTFENNYAKYLGGGIYALKQTNIFNSTFTDNEAGDGGGIYLESEGLIEDSLFKKNNAIGYGGAITNEDQVIIKNSQFLENTGKYSGAIYFKGRGHVEKSLFYDNSADLGGAISIYSNYINIINSEFKYNAAKQGASLYINGKAIKLENISFTNNQSDFESEICMIIHNTTFINLTYYNITKPVQNDEIENDTPKEDTNVAKTIAKKKTSISAKSKTFKLKTKPKKYVITLKTGKTPLKYKKIYLKLKGKTYAAKTNKKGHATFKIKLAKKGKFKCIIRFKGDKSYSSSKKTVYIKIK